MERRGFLKLFALAAASAALPTVALPQLAIAEEVPAGARYLANLRTVTAYDMGWGYYITRMDILGKGRNGLPVQMGVDIRHIGPKPTDRELEPALWILENSAKDEGIDLHSLIPLPDVIGPGTTISVRK